MVKIEVLAEFAVFIDLVKYWKEKLDRSNQSIN